MDTALDLIPRETGGTLLRVTNLVKHFPVTQGIVFQKQIAAVKAVDGISFEVPEGSTLGLVGESGCGKSTTARLVLRLLEPTSGTIEFAGDDITRVHGSHLRQLRKDMQIIFQDPYASLNPRMTVHDILAEPLIVHGLWKERGHKAIAELLERVGLNPDHAERYPHEFSGGQRQRIGIARALALRPRLIVCDEPVSALDVSVRAQVLNLLTDLQQEFKLTYLFISHDLSVVRQVCDRIAVMYLGKIAEVADRDRLYEAAMMPYTQALLSAVPIPDPEKERTRKRIVLQGDVPSPLNPPPACRFHTRCWKVQPICREVEPELIPREGAPHTHAAACHFAEPLKLV